MTLLDQIVILIAKYFIILPILLIIYVFVKSKDKKRFIVFAILSAIFSLILAYLAGSLYYNPRPFVVDNIPPLITHASNNGFPSDHTLLSATSSSVIFPFSLPIGITSWIITFLIGGARVYAGLHHVVDILGSMIISIVSSILAFYLTKKILRTKD